MCLGLHKADCRVQPCSKVSVSVVMSETTVVACNVIAPAYKVPKTLGAYNLFGHVALWHFLISCVSLPQVQ